MNLGVQNNCKRFNKNIRQVKAWKVFELNVFQNLKKSLKYRASSLSNATVLNVPDLNKTKSKLRDIRSPTVEARCTSVQSFNQAGDLRRLEARKARSRKTGSREARSRGVTAKKEHTIVSNATSHLVWLAQTYPQWGETIQIPTVGLCVFSSRHS